MSIHNIKKLKYSYINLSVIFGAALFLLSCSGGQTDLDKISLKTLEGQSINMDDFKGKRVFVNFWATWCKPCIQEMPTIAKAQDLVENESVVFLFPSNESADLILEFKERRNFDFTYVQAQNFEALNIQALPTTMIFNESGKLIFSEMGFRDWSTPENLTLISGK